MAKIVSDQDRIDYAGMKMQGPAATWYTYSTNPQCRVEDRIFTWEDLVMGLRRNFQAINPVKQARDKLASYQQRGDSLMRYTTTMRGLFLEIPSMSEEEKLDRYVRGLKPPLRKEVELEQPTTVEQAIKAAETIDAVWRQVGGGKSDNQRPNFNRGHYRGNYSRDNRGTPMELGAHRLEQDRGRPQGNHKGLQRDPNWKPLTPAEKDEYRANNRCTYCRKHGHLVAECPDAPPRRPNGRWRPQGAKKTSN